MWTFFDQCKLISKIEPILGRLSGTVKKQHILHSSCSSLNSSVKITSAIAEIWNINISFGGSDFIRTDLKFWWPVNPGSLAWCTKMLTIRFFTTFWSIWRTTRETVKLGRNKLNTVVSRLLTPDNWHFCWLTVVQRGCQLSGYNCIYGKSKNQFPANCLKIPDFQRNA